MKKALCTCIFLCSFAWKSFAQDQTIDGSLHLGTENGSSTGEGRRLFFGGLQANSDYLSMYRYNTSFNSSDLRVEIGDDFGFPGDRFIVGTRNWQDQVFHQQFSVQANGQVGIGPHLPGSMLTIRDHNSGLSFHPGNTSAYHGAIAFNREVSTGTIFNPSGNAFQIENGGQDNNLRIQVYNGAGAQVNANALVVAGNNGYIGIGTASPNEHLSVNGKIRAREIKVEVNNWPDYVFNKAHRLPSLSDLEKYINANHHLPGIPDAREAEEEGISLGEMNKKLLQKIEELTLYMIDLKRENEAIKKQLSGIIR